MAVYPKEVASSIRRYKNGTTKTFQLDALLARFDASGNLANANVPLEPPGYSRFRVSIFSADGGCNGNIRETEFDAIFEASKACLNDYFSSAGAQAPAGGPVKQVPFNMGVMSGKTPAQVVMEEGRTDSVMSQREFLVANAGKYPKNMEVVAAIDEAVEMFRKGTLTAAGNASATKKIYHSDSRSTGNEDAEGRKKVYGIDIDYHDGKFKLSIFNCRAAVTKEADGSLRVQMGQAVDQKKMEMIFKWDEWINIIGRASRILDSFNHCYFGSTWQAAEQLDAAERAKWAGNAG